ncbi:hypothetical protein LCGC14_3101890 [marine sediment metagenome]|uniref:Uncharacterized protein n=1 Tax=marine sediment metagenome TaxID=412755 RepID=A0A0F8W7X3_9ZZZZ
MKVKIKSFLIFLIFLASANSLPALVQVVQQEMGQYHNHDSQFTDLYSLYNQIFSPLRDYTMYGMYVASVLRVWSFNPYYGLPYSSSTWLSAHYNQKIIIYLTSTYQYSPITHSSLESDRFYQTMMLVKTSSKKFKIAIFSILVLKKIRLRPEDIIFYLGGRISPNLTYDLNFKINTEDLQMVTYFYLEGRITPTITYDFKFYIDTDKLYLEPVRTFSIIDNPISHSRFALNYSF